MKFSIKDFFSKCDLSFSGKLHFLCSDLYLAPDDWGILVQEFFNSSLKKQDWLEITIQWLAHTKLTHLFPMHPFSTSWKHQKTVRCFQEVEKGCIGNKWVNIQQNDPINYWDDSTNIESCISFQCLFNWPRNKWRYSRLTQEQENNHMSLKRKSNSRHFIGYILSFLNYHQQVLNTNHCKMVYLLAIQYLTLFIKLHRRRL